MRTSAILLSALVLISVLPRMALAADAGGEKVLLGFEREEAEKAVQGKKFPIGIKAAENGDFMFFQPILSNVGYEILHVRPMLCVQGNATQGKYACRILEPFDKNLASYPQFRLPRLYLLPLFEGEPQCNPRLGELFNSMGFFEWTLGRDWSGYDLLRVDIFLEQSDLGKLLLEVEDELVEPPVSYTYDAPAVGGWATLEMDLNEAVKDRGLDLKSMRNMWLRVVHKDTERCLRDADKFRKDEKGFDAIRFKGWLDNIRLCRKGTPAAHPVVTGTRSAYTLKLPRSYAVAEEYNKTEAGNFNRWEWPRLVPADTKMPEAVAVKPETEPVKLEKPSVIPVRELLAAGSLSPQKDPGNWDSIRLTTTAAVDSKRIIVGFHLLEMGMLKASAKAERPAARHCGAAVATTDGGATWKGLNGLDFVTSIGGNVSKPFPRPQDFGGDVMGIAPFGCSAFGNAHAYYPMDRVFFVRTVFTGDGWWLSPKYLVSGDVRHCHDIRLGDVVATPSGRIWAAYTATSRVGHGGRGGEPSSYVYCSDDGGVTWLSWRGRPGVNGALPKTLGLEMRLAPYRGQVAAFSKGKWVRFDGQNWSEPEPTGSDTEFWHAVSCGDEVYLSGADGPIRQYDGKSWQDFSVPGRTGKHGKIGTCGGTTLVFVEPDASGKKLLCWRRKAGGGWQGPQTLAEEKTEIVKVALQRYAPANFMPVAWSCRSSDPAAKPQKHTMWPFPDWDPWEIMALEPWIKLLKVPAE